MRNMMTVRLEDARFFGRHGVMKQERVCGNEFAVTLSVTFPYYYEESALGKVENLDASISYAELYAIVEEEMKEPRELLETIASRIAYKLRKQYPKITEGSVEITKIIPPIAGIDGKAGIKLNF